MNFWLVDKFRRGLKIFSAAAHLLVGTSSACRFDVTCTDYCVRSIQEHGWLRGLIRGSWRVLRCGPWGGFYEDNHG